ncbi:MAG: GGDEF domain-containing protein [Halothiobacillaceae bacterium]
MQEIYRQHLIIESDLQQFATHLLTVAEALGVTSMRASLSLNRVFAQARKLGAGRGDPLWAAVRLQGRELGIHWGDPGPFQKLLALDRPPRAQTVSDLQARLREQTQVLEPQQLVARNREMNRQFEQTRKRLHEEIDAMQTALTQRQEQLHQLMHLAQTDPLTGLLNRRAFDHRYEAAYNRTQRQSGELMSLILLDLDEFKALNDRYGHQHGDAYLQKMAKAMANGIRSDVDLCFRIGGDEFAILLFAGPKLARRKSEQVLDDMGGRVSIGIACLNDEVAGAMDHHRFFELADNALYASKRSGRGRITMADVGADGKPAVAAATGNRRVAG